MTNDELLAQYGPREAMEYDVVIVGAGPAGLAAAIRLKQLASEKNAMLNGSLPGLSLPVRAAVFLSQRGSCAVNR